MYIQHLNLEYMLGVLDDQNKGLITVGQLDEILQRPDQFNFPPQALDTVFREMLGEDIQNVDRNCVIKIDAFMESLRNQFED